ncbi:hypothetical protein NA8A_18227 [Nitratireductor indicus C115]|uniref:Uncharacterized protein n=1 Tax=Nitratireductor indicus C115 TaxID=1231190 RepID=K2NN57_9HYPH|nr:hypothetical protein NA8A_18227 [Nitratireductor indicus C115]
MNLLVGFVLFGSSPPKMLWVDASTATVPAGMGGLMSIRWRRTEHVVADNIASQCAPPLVGKDSIALLFTLKRPYQAIVSFVVENDAIKVIGGFPPVSAPLNRRRRPVLGDSGFSRFTCERGRAADRLTLDLTLFLIDRAGSRSPATLQGIGVGFGGHAAILHNQSMTPRTARMIRNHPSAPESAMAAAIAAATSIWRVVWGVMRPLPWMDAPSRRAHDGSA